MWGVLGAMIIYQVCQDAKTAERTLRYKQEKEEEQALREGRTIIQAQCLSCGTLADTATGFYLPRLRFICQECTEIALYLLEEYRNKKNQ
jgi:hypothetical protein